MRQLGSKSHHGFYLQVAAPAGVACHVDDGSPVRSVGSTLVDESARFAADLSASGGPEGAVE